MKKKQLNIHQVYLSNFLFLFFTFTLYFELNQFYLNRLISSALLSHRIIHILWHSQVLHYSHHGYLSWFPCQPFLSARVLPISFSTSLSSYFTTMIHRDWQRLHRTHCKIRKKVTHKHLCKKILEYSIFEIDMLIWYRNAYFAWKVVMRFDLIRKNRG